MKGVVRRSFSYLTPYWRYVAAGQFATLCSAAAGLVFPLIAKHIVDTLLGTRDASTLFLSVAIMGGAVLVLALSDYARQRTLGVASQRVVRDLRRQLFEKLQSLSVAYYDGNSSGNLVSVMTNDINLLQSTITGGAAVLVAHLFSLAGVLILLFRLDSSLALIIFALAPPMALISRVAGKRARAISTRVRTLLGNLTSLINESISGVDVIKSFVLEREAIRLFDEENSRVTTESIAAIRVRASNGLLMGILSGLFVVLIAGLGSLHVLQGRITAGDLVAFLIYAQMISGPIGMLSGLYVDIQQAMAAAKRIFALLDAQGEERVREQLTLAEHSLPLRGEIEFQEVTFQYDPGDLHAPAEQSDSSCRSDATSTPGSGGPPPALRGVSLFIGAGETVALVGPSGSGKSTILKLLLKFYTPTSGRILVDGSDIEEMDTEYLRSRIGVVMQDTRLFDRSIYENILCGNLEADRHAVVRAARLADAHEFISDLQEGYDTAAGENGVRLSGGQRQRIALARAILKDPPVLLLDEATSSLDTESERRIQRSLARFGRDRTTIIVAHRLSTIQHADRIFVMNQGRVVASGSHRELLRTCRLYEELCRNQLLPVGG